MTLFPRTLDLWTTSMFPQRTSLSLVIVLEVVSRSHF